MSRLPRDLEPTAAELAAIEDEWPLIDAELAEVDALAAIAKGDAGPRAHLRLLLARRHLAKVAAGFTPAGPDGTTFRPITPTAPIPAHSTSARAA